MTSNRYHNDKEQNMSRHPSFGRLGITKKRNVLKRYQRIDLLKKQGRLKDGASVFGLPKTKAQE